MKEAILVVSFGTTHLDTLEKTIAAVEADIAAAYPGIECRRAFTSGIVRSRLKEKFGIEVDGASEALAKLASEGFERVTVQPTLLLPGEEFDKLRSAALEAAGDMLVSVGLPLLWDDGDLAALTQILVREYPMPEGTVLLAMGHGTSHEADALYKRLALHFKKAGIHICTVEGSISFEDALEELCAGSARRAHLVPLLLVAGDHSKNDMAGGLKGLLEEKGFEVTFSLKGLGELKLVRERFVKRAAAAKQGL